MTTRILLLADIHGNYPALMAIDRELGAVAFDYVINCGDSLVYAPFPNETLAWLVRHQAISILGNTDKKIIRLLRGTPFKKPSKPEKRIMYTSTAEALDEAGKNTLLALAETAQLLLPGPPGDSPKHHLQLGIFHGSPTDPDEFLFADTPDARFHELAGQSTGHIIVTGHSHSPYHKTLSGTHFINPGSAGRMFDGDPRASCAVLEIAGDTITVRHFRISYEISEVVAAIRGRHLPEIYAAMFLQGKKLN